MCCSRRNRAYASAYASTYIQPNSAYGPSNLDPSIYNPRRQGCCGANRPPCPSGCCCRRCRRDHRWAHGCGGRTCAAACGGHYGCGRHVCGSMTRAAVLPVAANDQNPTVYAIDRLVSQRQQPAADWSREPPNDLESKATSPPAYEDIAGFSPAASMLKTSDEKSLSSDRSGRRGLFKRLMGM